METNSGHKSCGLLLERPTEAELESTFEAFVRFLIKNKHVSTANKLDLSLVNLKTIYNLKFKHDNNPIIGFSELQQFAVRRGLMMVQPTEVVFPLHGIVTTNKTLQQQQKQPGENANMRKSAEKMKKGREKVLRNVVPLDLGNWRFAATVLNPGFDKKLVSASMETLKPLLLFVANTNLDETVRHSDLQIGGYQHFQQDVEVGEGGILIYANTCLNPHYLPQMETDDYDYDYESIWVKLSLPLPPHNTNSNLARPQFVVGNVRNHKGDPRGGSEMSKYLLKSFATVHTKFPGCHVLLLADIRNMGNNMEAALNSLKASYSLTSNCINYKGVNGKLHSFLIIKSAFFQGAALDWSCPLDPPDAHQGFVLVTVQEQHCSICDELLCNKDSLTVHLRSERHKRNYFAIQYNRNRAALISTKHGLEFFALKAEEAEVEQGSITFSAAPGVAKILKLSLKNVGQTKDQRLDPKTGLKLGIILKSIDLLTDEPGFRLSDKYNFTLPVALRPKTVRDGIRMHNGQALTIEVHCVQGQIGQHKVPLLVSYLREDTTSDGLEGKKIQVLARELVLKVTNDDVDFLGPSTPYERPKPLRSRVAFTAFPVETVPGLPLDRSTEKQQALAPKMQLGHYPIKNSLQRLISNGLKAVHGLETMSQKYQATLDTALEPQNYAERFSLLLSCEEHQMQLDIRNYDLTEVTMEARGNQLLALTVPGLAENRPSVLQGDRLYATVRSEKKEYEAYVHEVEDTKVLLGFSSNLRNRYVPNMKFDVRFTFNRFPLRNMHRAVEMLAKSDDLLQRVFPKADTDSAQQQPKQKLNFFSNDIANDPQQNLAVQNILSGGIPGVPYIIFGPPGTGKTVTMSEAIKQVWRNCGHAHIVAVAPSNSAADLLAVKLLQQIPKSNLIRLYAPSRMEKHVPDELKEVSNYHSSHSNTSLSQMVTYKVIVVTLVTAGRLASAQFPEDHFSHIFIDEAGHATEPEAVIAVAGLLSKNKGQLVLAGDPKQLGPVLRSPISLRYGLHVSLLERLMTSKNIDIYQRDPKSDRYNPRVITKLLNNFRSHPSLLTLPSRMFYDSELVPKADPFGTNWLLKWDYLPKKGFPIIFHGVVGDDKREGRSPSFFNPEEAALVVKYIEDLFSGRNGANKEVKAREIGVISPYRRQVQKIKDLMNRKFQNRRPPVDWKPISVGSTEQFQGQERPIIIISTVRSKPELLKADFQLKLGFLKNPKRFNVATTRAKALMIVVGNPFLLTLDKNWKEFIKYVIDNGGYRGTKFSMEVEEDNLKMKAVEDAFNRLGLDEGQDDEVDVLEDVNALTDISQGEYQQGLEWRSEH